MKTHTLTLFVVLLSTLSAASQNIPVIQANTVKNSLSYTDQEIKDWEYYLRVIIPQFEENDWQINLLSADDQRLMKKIGLGDANPDLESTPFMLIGPGCSWYCGAVYDTKVSSELPSTDKNNYGMKSVEDNDTRTAWIEGVKGYGIGEYIEFEFSYIAPRATSCQIANGYNKNASTWKNNSRVKALNIYEDEKLIAIVNLADTRDLQEFDLPYPIPNLPNNFNRTSYDYDDPNIPRTTLRFMITEVYKGDKYDDTAISEVIFNWIDVHCLAQGTQITMANGKDKNIEEIAAGDSVLSYNTDTKMLEIQTVKHLHSATHKHLLMVTLDSDDELFVITTDDHPFLTTEGWKSYNPQKTMQYPRYATPVGKYEEGGKLLMYKEGKVVSTDIISIVHVNDSIQTYTLELQGRGAFIANGLLVGQE